MKDNSVYKQAYNNCLAVIADLPIGALLGAEPALAKRLHVSRTTVRAILVTLHAAGILKVNGREKRVLRRPRADEYFSETETEPSSQLIERRVKEWLLAGDLRPGDAISSLELARLFNVSTSGIREYLNRFSRYGLIQRRPNASWVFQGFTRDFALELCDIREMFEMRSIHYFTRTLRTEEGRHRLNALEAAHLDLLRRIESGYHEFSRLDESFHRTVNDAANNRFITDFYEIISLIFHYHLQWAKHDERERNEVALHEHLAIIHALKVDDTEGLDKAVRTHMQSARETLLRSI
ncbi:MULTISPECIES: GntR family transcriptional regulator [unclassified Chelatococcus]|uniref:GntR family transcriptional regulator n=1 Tax=unclassified Chelatococcus TaxID=2638111 RepID=UPI001BCC2D16|nr:MULTISPECIES: GntR family transcriptional regulator [unclassified Chelatococcus]MBS7699815.1 GntR family transcriptional regulator [Chelatococcus sp. YT9]MBX3558161.1 GntR family transcriptional regulator [Chelatococcus sp.]